MNYDIQRPIATKTEGQMSRDELYARVAKATRCQKKRAKKIISAAFDEMIGMMQDGWDILIPRFGAFRLITVEEHQAINPRTLETITVPRKKKVRFRASDPLKRAALEAPDEKIYLEDKIQRKTKRTQEEKECTEKEEENKINEEYVTEEEYINQEEYSLEDDNEEYLIEEEDEYLEEYNNQEEHNSKEHVTEKEHNQSNNKKTNSKVNNVEEDDADEWACI